MAKKCARSSQRTCVMDELIRRMTASRPNSNNDVCYGTLLSREQRLHDLERLKYRDSRAEPLGPMTAEEIGVWTAAIVGAEHR